MRFNVRNVRPLTNASLASSPSTDGRILLLNGYDFSEGTALFVAYTDVPLCIYGAIDSERNRN